MKDGIGEFTQQTRWLIPLPIPRIIGELCKDCGVSGETEKTGEQVIGRQASQHLPAHATPLCTEVLGEDSSYQ